MSENEKELKKSAKAELSSWPLLFKKAKRGMNEEERKQGKSLAEALEASLKSKNEAALKKSLEEYLSFKDKYFSAVHFNKTWEALKEFLWIIAIVLFIRWIFIEPFRIPSGSMIPTLVVGDQLMVNKLIYGVQIPFTTKKLFTLKTPKRGDVIIFKYPPHPSESPYVKRVVGLPGDTVSVKAGQLTLNGQVVPRQYVEIYTGPSDRGPCLTNDLYVEILGDVRHDLLLCHLPHDNDNFGPVTVPANSVFGMGDNRDNSADSRYWGFIPMDNIKGKALFIHLPLDPDRYYLPRWGRFFKRIK